MQPDRRQSHLDDLRRRARERSATHLELLEIASAIESGDTAANRYNLLQALGESGGRSFRPLIEEKLESRDDPFMARVALDVLCNDWGETARYLGTVRRFLKGVDWDEIGDVRDIAISAAGRHLQTHDDANLLRDLLEIALSPSEDEGSRKWSVFWLGRAIGDSALGRAYNDKFSLAGCQSILTAVSERVRNTGKEA